MPAVFLLALLERRARLRDAVSLLSAALFFRAAALPCSRISAMACCALVLGAAFAAAFAASRCLRLGLPGSLLRSASTSGENLNVSHLSRMNLRISSSEGSAPNTTRAAESPPSSTLSTVPTQNCPSK